MRIKDIYEFDATSREMMLKDYMGRGGVYAFYLKGMVAYIGQARDLGERLMSHMKCMDCCGDHDKMREDKATNVKYYVFRDYIDDLEWEILEDLGETAAIDLSRGLAGMFKDRPREKTKLDNRETYYINLYQPLFNIAGCGWKPQMKSVCMRDVKELMESKNKVKFMKMISKYPGAIRG